jgi:hypothetical protein
MSGCKIGRVKLKNGATVLPLPVPKRDATQKHMIDHAIYGAGSYPKGVHGFILIAWDDQTTWSSVQINNGSRVGVSQAPSFAADETRRAFFRSGDW